MSSPEQSNSKRGTIIDYAPHLDFTTILDSVTFGRFSYWAPGKIPPFFFSPFVSLFLLDLGSTHDQRSQMALIPKLPRLQIPDSTSLHSRSTQNLPTPSPTALDRLLTDAKQRLGRRNTMEITHHPLFDEMDWRTLANCKAPILDYLRMLSYSCISEVAPEGLGS